MEVIIYKGFWNRDTPGQFKDYIFLYGDNDAHFGEGGQVIIRKSKNAMGIPTKKYPNNDESSFYTDEEYEENVKKINNAFSRVWQKLSSGKWKGIVVPENGFGNGLSQLPSRALKQTNLLRQH